MINPFQYGGIVGADSFCNRVHERRDLRREIENGNRVFLYSERRMGKTSLVKLVLDELPRTEFIPVYIDLWPTDSIGTFASRAARAFAESVPRPLEKMIADAKRLFERLRPSVTVDEQGAPVVRFDIAAGDITVPDIESILQAPQALSEQHGKTMVVVYDEFQRILEYESDQVERTLRSLAQGQSGVAYLFLGSRKHLIRNLFLDQSRPLYRSATHYPIASIEADSWKPYLAERFQRKGASIAAEAFQEVMRLTGGHPFYVQHLAHIIWERSEPGKHVDVDDVGQAVNVLLLREQYAFASIWDSLTRVQQRLLRGIAAEGSRASIFSSQFIKRFGISAPSTVNRAVKALIDRDLVDREADGYLVTDRFLAMWIRRIEAGLGG